MAVVLQVNVFHPRSYSDGGEALQFGMTLTGAAPAGGISCTAAVSGYTVPMQ